MTGLTKSALRQAGWEALVERLGPAGAARFLSEYSAGSGDYTESHRQWAKSVTDDKLFRGLKLAGKARPRAKPKR